MEPRKRYVYEILPGHMISPARYSFQRNIYGLIKQLSYPAGNERILDFGCGTAVFRFYFSNKPYFGFDINNRSFFRKNGGSVALCVADGRFVPFKDCSFGLVLCNAVLEHIEDDQSAAREAFRMLKRGGHCCVVVPSSLSPVYDEIPFRLIGRKGHGEHYYSRRAIADLLTDVGFEINEISASMGFFCSLLKFFYVYQRGLRVLIAHLLSGLFRVEFPVRGESGVWNVFNSQDLELIANQEYAQEKNLKYLYRKLLELCFYLDKKIYFSSHLACEWLVVARKP